MSLTVHPKCSRTFWIKTLYSRDIHVSSLQYIQNVRERFGDTVRVDYGFLFYFTQDLSRPFAKRCTRFTDQRPSSCCPFLCCFLGGDVDGDERVREPVAAVLLR